MAYQTQWETTMCCVPAGFVVLACRDEDFLRAFHFVQMPKQHHQRHLLGQTVPDLLIEELLPDAARNDLEILFGSQIQIDNSA
jgi:hypothetical protein